MFKSFWERYLTISQICNSRKNKEKAAVFNYSINSVLWIRMYHIQQINLIRNHKQHWQNFNEFKITVHKWWWEWLLRKTKKIIIIELRLSVIQVRQANLPTFLHNLPSIAKIEDVIFTFEFLSIIHVLI